MPFFLEARSSDLQKTLLKATNDCLPLFERVPRKSEQCVNQQEEGIAVLNFKCPQLEIKSLSTAHSHISFQNFKHIITQKQYFLSVKIKDLILKIRSSRKLRKMWIHCRTIGKDFMSVCKWEAGI